MDARFYMSAGAALLVVAALVLYLVYRRRARAARQHTERLLIGPRLEAWTAPARHAPVGTGEGESRSPETAMRVPVEPAVVEPTSVDAIKPPPSTHEIQTPPFADDGDDYPGPESPVELTVGDSRIPVSEGTDTHARLKAYADALLDDLKAARRRTR